MLLMSVLFVLFAMTAVGVTVGVLALIEVLFGLNPSPRIEVEQPRLVTPVAFNVETLRRAAHAELMSQSA
jgi:hypothetical protein